MISSINKEKIYFSLLILFTSLITKKVFKHAVINMTQEAVDNDTIIIILFVFFGRIIYLQTQHLFHLENDGVCFVGRLSAI